MTKAGWDLDAIVDAFARAAVDPSKWADAMEIASDQLGGSGTTLIPVNGRLPQIECNRSLASTFDAHFGDGGVNRDECYGVLPAVIARGVGSDLDLTTPESLAKDPCYREFLAPFDHKWSAVVKITADDDLWAMSVQRSISQGPFQKHELAKLAELSARLSTPATLARALGFARVDAALAAFEIGNIPAITFDRFGHLLRTNQAAQKVLGRDVFICQRRLRAARQGDAESLDKAIHQLLWEAGPAMLPPVTVTRAEGRPILLHLLRPKGIALEAFSPCRGLIIAVDPDRELHFGGEAFARLFGLSAAECRLAVRLLNGSQLEAAAGELKISYETARTTLKRIFQKTGTDRQAELILILTKIAIKFPIHV